MQYFYLTIERQLYYVYNLIGDKMYINMLSDYLKDTFGEKLYRISLDGGMTCPNRDGTCGERGCIFCNESGSGEFTPDRFLSLNEQIEAGKTLVAHKTKSDKYIAYFQAFSNTYAPIEYLQKLFTEVINREDIAVLSIATRPDCLGEDVIMLLNELNNIKPVWVELGLQSAKEETAEFIRRGYKNQIYEEAVTKLKSAGCKVITHLILGLPNETKDDMINSARYAGKNSDGVKFHMLYVTKDSDLDFYYKEVGFHVLSREEYIDILCGCIRVIPKSVVIHRLTGDGEKSKLIAPLWSQNKKKVLREISNAFIDRNIEQGEYI